MAHSVIMPKAGMAMETGTIVRWFKEVGDRVEIGEPLLEIETDKVTMEVEAEFSGTLLAVLKEPGDTVPVTETIGYVGEAGEPVPESTLSAEQTDGAAGAPETVGSGARIAATPAAKRLAAEHGVSLETVTGAKTKTPSGGTDAPVRESDVRAVLKSLAAGSHGEPLSGMRAVIADRMLESHLTIPPVTLNTRARVSRLLQLREELNAARRTGTEPKISINDLVLKATAIALASHPALNATFSEGLLKRHQEVALGMAVALEHGLVVPVLRNLEKRPVREIARQTAETADRARRRELTSADLSGGTFTVTNLGMYGIVSFNPVINPPQVAILGVCAVQRTAVAESLEEGTAFMGLSLTIDHRVIDGAQGALFLQTLVELLENPISLLR
jgi:pyruvate dehydrogenase E2 component (dihydrolipoamide acetyltransferase)